MRHLSNNFSPAELKMCKIIKMIFCLLLLFFTSTLGKNISRDPRIINGEDAALGQFPWDIQILIMSSVVGPLWCAGALISNEWILTSAHCLGYEGDIVVSAGIVDGIIDWPINEIIKDYIVHEDYDNVTSQNDIAVLRLPDPLEFTDVIQPIALAEEELPSGTVATVSGWGNVGLVGDYYPFLQYALVTTLENSDCQTIYGADVVTSKVVCATGQDPIKNPCFGDGGAPLVTDADSSPKHVGLFSFISSVGCDQGYPAGYTRTAAYRDWIRTKTGV